MAPATASRQLIEEQADKVSRRLGRLRATLGLTTRQVAAVLDSSPSSVSRWLNGTTEPSPEVAGRIARIDSELDRLIGLFEAGRLPSIVRRTAELFDGETALDWILDGRIREVADRYDRVLLYQG